MLSGGGRGACGPHDRHDPDVGRLEVGAQLPRVTVGTALLSTLATSATTAFLAGSAATPAAQPAAAVHGYTTAFGWSAALFAAGAVVAATLYKRGVPQVAPAAEPAAALH